MGMQDIESSRKTCRTYEGLHVPEQFRDTIQAAQSQNLVVVQFPAKRVVPQAKQVNIRMIGVKTLL